MTINNINNLPLNASYDIGQGGSVGNISNPTTVPSTTPQGDGQVQARQSGLGGSVDWFSQLNSGSTQPISANGERFGKNPPIDTIVDAILNDLGIQE